MRNNKDYKKSMKNSENIYFLIFIRQCFNLKQLLKKIPVVWCSTVIWFLKIISPLEKIASFVVWAGKKLSSLVISLFSDGELDSGSSAVARLVITRRNFRRRPACLGVIPAGGVVWRCFAASFSLLISSEKTGLVLRLSLRVSEIALSLRTVSSSAGVRRHRRRRHRSRWSKPAKMYACYAEETTTKIVTNLGKLNFIDNKIPHFHSKTIIVNSR